jgi:ParB family chromosome partitioning protein
MNPTQFPTTDEVVEVPIGRLLDNPLNEYLRGDTITPESCAELTASVAEHGINTPLLVTPYRDAFRIVYGHRRKMAAKCANLTKVPCIIKTISDEMQFEIMFAENMQRKDLTLRAEARCYKKFADEGKTLPEIERKTGISKPRIKTMLALINLEPEVQTLFEEEKLPIGAVQPLSKLTDRNTQLYLARAAAKDKSTLRTIEAKVERALGAVPMTDDPGTKTKPRKRPNALLDSNGDRLTKSEALALFAEEETFTLRDITRAILGSCCDNCDERRFPEICKACPLAQMLATLLEIKGAQSQTPAITEEIKPANERLH